MQLLFDLRQAVSKGEKLSLDQSNLLDVQVRPRGIRPSLRPSLKAEDRAHMLRAVKAVGEFLRAFQGYWWLVGGTASTAAIWLLGILEQRPWSELLVLGLTTFAIGALLTIALVALVKLLWPAPDLSEWRKNQELALWQAAQLWVGEWPDPNNMRGRSYPVFTRLKEAVRNGVLTRIDSHRAAVDMNTMVKRADLKAYADSTGEKPDFLFP
jgi:hypothetical protein